MRAFFPAAVVKFFPLGCSLTVRPLHDSPEAPKTPGLVVPGAYGVMSACDVIMVTPGDVIGDTDIVEFRIVGDSVAQDWARAMKDDLGQWFFRVHEGRVAVSARVRRGSLVSEPSPPQTINVLGKYLAEPLSLVPPLLRHALCSTVVASFDSCSSTLGPLHCEGG